MKPYKKSGIYGLLVALVFSFSFIGNTGPKELLVKKWKFNVEEFKKEITQLLEKTKQEATGEQLEQIKIVESMIPMMETMLTNTTFEFKRDNSYEISSNGETESGQWKLSADQKSLEMRSATEGAIQSFEIKEITATKLVLLGEGTEGLPMVFSPLK